MGDRGPVVPVVMFARKIDRRIAGGARAVLDRANVLAERGHDVHLILTEPSPASDAGLTHLRRRRMLHPAVNVEAAWLSAPTEAHRRRALTAPVQPLPQPGPTWRSVEVESGESGVRDRVDYFDGDTLTRRDRYHEGTLVYVNHYDDEKVRKRWVLDHLGRVASVVEFEDGLPVKRHQYVAGAFRWLTGDVSAGEGRGAVHEWVDYSTSGARMADVVADWLDRRFASHDRVVVFADGENLSQHALRSMKHPGVRGVSILHNCHTVYPHGSDDATKPHWEPYFDNLTNIDVMVCLTGRQRDDIIDRYPEIEPRVVHHAVPERIAPKVRRDHRKVVFVGRLQEQKQVDHAIRAFRKVSDMLEGVTFDIYGSGVSAPELSELVTRLGLDSRVEFKGFTNDSGAAFASGAVAVMSSLYEGLPLTLTEAMAVGTPFVSYDVNYGPSEVIQNGVNGWLVPKGDIDALARGLMEALRDRARTRAMGERARAVAIQFSRERYATTWTDLAEELGASARRP